MMYESNHHKKFNIQTRTNSNIFVPRKIFFFFGQQHAGFNINDDIMTVLAQTNISYISWLQKKKISIMQNK